MQIKKPSAEEFIQGAKADQPGERPVAVAPPRQRERVGERERAADQPRPAPKETKTYPLVLDKELHRALKKAAIDADMTLNDYILNLLAGAVRS